MKLTSAQRFKLKTLIKELKQYKGRHTEFVTIYIPQGYDINKISTHVAQEQGTATNIKSNSTRKNVIESLEKIIQHLKLYKQTPENGLCLFAGNVAEKEGQNNMQVWAIEPPVPINTRIYRCDKTFVLHILEDMVEIKEGYGLVVMDRREGTIALLKGKSIQELSTATSNVPGKTKAGGQSAARYGRIREGAAKDFYKKIASMVQEAFLGNDDIKGIIVGGPGFTKYEFVEKDYINNELKKKIIGIKDLSYTGMFGVNELVDKSDDLLANEDIMEEKGVMNQFFTLLNTDQNKAAYGKDMLLKLMDMGAIEIVLLSENVDDKIIEYFEEKGQEFSTEVKIISTETREGVQLRDMGGYAAILRYSIENQ
jgi:peptide chain release factor subunit 1